MKTIIAAIIVALAITAHAVVVMRSAPQRLHEPVEVQIAPKGSESAFDNGSDNPFVEPGSG